MQHMEMDICGQGPWGFPESPWKFKTIRHKARKQVQGGEGRGDLPSPHLWKVGGICLLLIGSGCGVLSHGYPGA